VASAVRAITAPAGAVTTARLVAVGVDADHVVQFVGKHPDRSSDLYNSNNNAHPT
jgi:hypothetical protein